MSDRIVHLPLCGQLRPHVSYSELRLFAECNWKWFLTKVLDKRIEERSFQMDFGKAVHSGMEVLYSSPTHAGDVVYATEHALRMYDEALSTLQIDHPTDLAESRRIREFIPRFYADCLVCPELAGITTLRSELQLMSPIARTDGLELMFKGFIDILFVKKLKRKSVIYVADFKTCQWGWPAEKFQDPQVISQILLYKHFFVKMTGADPRNVSVAFILLKKKPKDGDLTVDVRKISAGPKATQRALDFLQGSIAAMHRYSYEKNYVSCVRSWKDPETKEERIVRCPFMGTEDCDGSD